MDQICIIQKKSLYYFIRGTIMNPSNQPSSNGGSRFPRDWMNIISRELGEVAREFAEGVHAVPSAPPPLVPEYQNTHYNAPPFSASEPSVPLYSNPGTSSGPSPGPGPSPSPGPVVSSPSPATRSQHIIDLDEMIYRYSENMRQYSHTMREMVQLVSQLSVANRATEELSQVPVPAPAPAPQLDTTVDYTTIFSYLLYPATNTMNTSTNTTFLTREQIFGGNAYIWLCSTGGSRHRTSTR